jgi:hypothetical protein
MTDVRPGSLVKKLAALLVARGGRCWSLFVVFRRIGVVACTVGDGRVRTGKQGFSSPAVVSSHLLTLEAPPGFEPGMKVLQTSGQDDVNPDDAKTSHLINDRLSLNLPLREEIPADLRFIVDAWAELSEAIQQAMLAMVQATVKRGDGE